MKDSLETYLRVYEDADKILATPNNWIKGKFRSKDKCDGYCLYGAISEAAETFELWRSYNLYNEVRMVIRDITNDSDQDTTIRSQSAKAAMFRTLITIIGFNDQDETTFEDVKNVLAVTIKSLQERVAISNQTEDKSS